MLDVALNDRAQDGPLIPPFLHRIAQDLKDKYNHPLSYQLIRDTRFDQFRGRIRILWDRSENLWVRQFDYVNREVIGMESIDGNWILPDSRESVFRLISPQETDELPLLDEYPEGARMMKTHLSIERNQALVRGAKSQFKRLHGRLYCQPCEFDFLQIYAENSIECNHIIPVP